MLKQSDYVKIRVAVPIPYADAIREALGNAGAGVQGNYTYCSSSYKTIGRFIPMKDAHPAIGSHGVLEKIEEEIIETICHKNIVKTVIEAVKKIHPYEESVIDILPRLEVQ